jgi:hypothetical protein
MKKCVYLAILLSLMCSILYAAPAQQYQINMIVFTHITSQALQSERWANELRIPSLKNVAEPTLLLDNQMGLQKETDALSKTNGYQIIYQQSWAQPMNNKWIHIVGGQAYDKNGKPTYPPEGSPPAFWQLNGRIKITKATFFNIYTQLYLTMPESIFGGDTDQDAVGSFQPIPLTTFTLFHTRHTKLNELNYLDHPLFGVLIQITPMKS